MKIVALHRHEDFPKRFTVRFDDGVVVNASAAELQTYERFQRAVLAETGKRYQCDQVEAQPRAFDRAAVWLVEITVAMQGEVTP